MDDQHRAAISVLQLLALVMRSQEACGVIFFFTDSGNPVAKQIIFTLKYITKSR